MARNLPHQQGLPTHSKSAFADLFASLRAGIPAVDGLNFDARVYVISYFDADEFNQSHLDTGMSYETRTGAWNTELAATVGFGQSGGESFDQSQNLGIRIYRPVSQNSSISLRYQFSEIDARDPAYPGVEGQRQRFNVRYRWQTGRHRVETIFGHESNNRLDPEVSPDRNLIGISYDYAFKAAWSARIGARYRGSDYRDQETDRSEDLTSIRAELHRDIGDSWRVIVQLRKDSQDSTEPLLSYERNLLSAGFVRLF